MATPDFTYDEIKKGMTVLVLNDDGTPYKVGTVFSKTTPVTDEEKANPGLHQTIEVAFDKQIMGVSLWHLARPLSDEWSDAPTVKIPPLSGMSLGDAMSRQVEREQDEAEESYFLASSDVVLGLSARQAGLLADFLSHDMDMITTVVADADESDVQALRLQLERKTVNNDGGAK